MAASSFDLRTRHCRSTCPRAPIIVLGALARRAMRSQSFRSVSVAFARQLETRQNHLAQTDRFRSTSLFRKFVSIRKIDLDIGFSSALDTNKLPPMLFQHSSDSAPGDLRKAGERFQISPKRAALPSFWVFLDVSKMLSNSVGKLS